MRLTWAQSVAALVGAALLVGASISPAVEAQSTVQVQIQYFVYQPDPVVVPAGTTVVWSNLDPVVHTVTAYDGSFDSGEFADATTFSLTFTAPGTYPYYCVPHPTMVGTVEVTG